MRRFRELGRRLVMLFRPEQFDADLEEELFLHRELREHEHREAGAAPRAESTSACGPPWWSPRLPWRACCWSARVCCCAAFCEFSTSIWASRRAALPRSRSTTTMGAIGRGVAKSCKRSCGAPAPSPACNQPACLTSFPWTAIGAATFAPRERFIRRERTTMHSFTW